MNRLISSSDDEHLEYVAECFRPLSRYIGLYLAKTKSVFFLNSFRPLSRYIGLYQIISVCEDIFEDWFPSPLEVYRFISARYNKEKDIFELVSVPSRGI